MPLPDAGKPKESNVYTQLRTKTIQTVTPDNFDVPKDPVYIQPDNEDEARRLKLWGELTGSLSSSGPIDIKRITATVSSAATYEFHKPDEGEIWVLLWAGFSGGSSSSNRIYQGDNDNSDEMIFTSSSAIYNLWADGEISGLAPGIYYNSNYWLKVYSNPTSGDTEWRGYSARIR